MRTCSFGPDSHWHFDCAAVKWKSIGMATVHIFSAINAVVKGNQFLMFHSLHCIACQMTAQFLGNTGGRYSVILNCKQSCVHHFIAIHYSNLEEKVKERFLLL